MRSVLFPLEPQRVLALGLLVVLLSVGCSKNDDDCSAPASSDPDATTRMSGDVNDDKATDEPRPAAGYRNAEDNGGDIDAGGISDDGDDEADGEGNKKNRPLH